ncbi:enoyl-CoA hydratase/isomerase family protein [Rhodococcus sp. BP-316]|uniref:enoyl-CoA hydratase/isomerase family protein n=1 Tax=Rhodococcus sp. BP-316 TaxID=2739445 RepID=UPI001C9A7914|nr:enoyl-CoA hydratase/isomerase family protein [Rhodococcus sp. BP-316]MBY6681800.1 enoyl-CoA hydratase/isomerase family protein [Rhodococcus sp. BP-316]
MRDRTGAVLVEERTPGEIHVTIDRHEQRNALSTPILEALLDGVRCAERRRTRIIVISAVGEHFSAGADLDEITGCKDDRAWFDAMSNLTAALTQSSAITVASITGACIGAGLELAVGCDIRVASHDAFFAMPSVRMGLVYDPTAVTRIRALVGPTAAQRLLVLGERMSASDAHGHGLITSLTADANADTSHLISQLDTSIDAARETLRLINAAEPTAPRWRDIHHRSLDTPERAAAVVRARRRTSDKSAR